eukprot:gene15147-21209_t
MDAVNVMKLVEGGMSTVYTTSLEAVMAGCPTCFMDPPDGIVVRFAFAQVMMVTVSLSDGSSGSPLRKNQIAVGFYKQAHEAASARDITLLYLTDGLYKPVGRASDLNFCMGSMRKWEAAVKSGPEGVKQLLVDMKIRSFFVDLKEKHIVSYVSGNKFMVRAEGGLQLAYSFLSGDGKSNHLTSCKLNPPEKPKKYGVKKDVFAFWNAHVAAREARKKAARAAAKAAGPKCHVGPLSGAASGSACRGPVPPSRAAEPTCGTAPVIPPVLGTCENLKVSLLAGKNLLVQGPAGSGKTVFINSVIVPGLIEKNLDVLQAKYGVPLLASDVLGNEVLVCSTTGISAMAVAGSTLHSIMGIQKCQGSYESIKKRVGNHARERMRSLLAIVLDEGFMASKKVFTTVDQLLKDFRGNNLPWGGVQVVFVGDLLQLGPIDELVLATSDSRVAEAHFLMPDSSVIVGRGQT